MENQNSHVRSLIGNHHLCLKYLIPDLGVGDFWPLAMRAALRSFQPPRPVRFFGPITNYPRATTLLCTFSFRPLTITKTTAYLDGFMRPLILRTNSAASRQPMRRETLYLFPFNCFPHLDPLPPNVSKRPTFTTDRLSPHKSARYGMKGKGVGNLDHFGNVPTIIVIGRPLR